MPIRNASATWQGSLKEGKGTVSVESGIMSDVSCGYSKRFENEKGSNPEELIGAAHASCFSMALAGALAKDGYQVNNIETEDKVHLDAKQGGFAIDKIDILCEADISDIDDETFTKYANDAKNTCPVSKALAGVEFTLNTKLKVQA